MYTYVQYIVMLQSVGAVQVLRNYRNWGRDVRVSANSVTKPRPTLVIIVPWGGVSNFQTKSYVRNVTIE